MTVAYVIIKNNAVVTAFACSQIGFDAGADPGYSVIDDSDPRYVAFVAAQSAPPPRYLTKNQIINRLTDAELTAVAAALAAQPLRIQWLWDHATEIDSTDQRVVGLLTALFGVDRAAELLA